MEEQIYIKLQNEFPDTHYLLYKKAKYPIKIDYFKLSSKYFQRNNDEFKQTETISIDFDGRENDEKSISTSTIQEFIQFVQHQQILLHKSNVIGLKNLSEIFEVDELKEITQDYIKRNQKELVLDLLLQNSTNQNNGFYEEIISNDFSHFLDDDRLFDLNISTLYRIFSKIKQKSLEKTKEMKQKINKFIFKFFDKNDRKSSILFTFLENEELTNDQISLIMNEYYDFIDFEFINKTFCKQIYSKLENEKQLNKHKSKIMDEIKENQEKERVMHLQEISSLEEKMANETKQKENEFCKKLKAKDIENQQLKNEKENERLLHEEEIKQMKTEFNEKERRYESEKKKYEEKISEITKEKESMLNKIKEQEESSSIHKFNYTPGQEFNGIIKYLTNQTGGNIHDNNTIYINSNSINSHPKNLLRLDHGFYGALRNASDFWICFDFKNMEVEISNYSIKSSDDPKNVGHIKSWKIEVSSDETHWETIDEHSNSNELNGPNIIKTFSTKKNHFSRYIRFYHKGSYWGSDEGYNFWLNSIEFFGCLKKAF